MYNSSQSDEREHEVERGEDDQHDGEDDLADVVDVGRGALRLPDGPRLIAELERPPRLVVLVQAADKKEFFDSLLIMDLFLDLVRSLCSQFHPIFPFFH